MVMALATATATDTAGITVVDMVTTVTVAAGGATTGADRNC